MPKFSVELFGVFHTFTLYDARGREVFDLNEAAETAELEYGDGWNSVFNGNESITRNDWINDL